MGRGVTVGRGVQVAFGVLTGIGVCVDVGVAVSVTVKAADETLVAVCAIVGVAEGEAVGEGYAVKVAGTPATAVAGWLSPQAAKMADNDNTANTRNLFTAYEPPRSRPKKDPPSSSFWLISPSRRARRASAVAARFWAFIRA